jgi:hypothetical protein
MDERAHGVEQVNVLDAWQQALAEVPQTPALAGARRADLFGRFAAWYGRLRSRPRAERRRWQRQLGLSLAGVALILAVNGAPIGAVGPAAMITVTDSTGTVANNGACSLPEAIINANNNAATHADCTAGSGADTISLSTNVTLTAVNNTTISGANGLPVITSSITIEGNGQAISRQVGSPNFRILTVNSGGNLILNSATISGGSRPGGGGGGGIYNQGTLTVQNSTISGNSADSARGGGINNYGTMTMQNSTLSGNSAGARGGGIQNWGTLTVSSSTLSGNSATLVGGGIANAGTLTMQNSTLFGNSADTGGGISNQSTLTVSNSTLSGGSASSGGGGIHNLSNVVTVQNSIVAMQAAGVADCSIGSGTLTSLGYNIESGTSCGFTGTGDQQSVSSASLALGALANNGGPTQTRALGFGSVALDHIPVGALEANGCGVTVTTDQRGLPRAAGAGAGGSACDVGAYEAQTPPLAVTLASFDAQAMIDHIQLSWETVSEMNNAGFNLYRSASPAGPEALLAYVPSQAPGSTQGASYSFDDTEVAAGETWYYWLEDVDLNGATALHGPVSATMQAPTAVTLGALEAQAANPGSVTAWGALVAALIAAAGVLGVRRRSRVE